MERLIMRIEIVGAETLAKINETFRKKVQLKEQADENEVQLHFLRGILWGLNKAEEVIKEVGKGEQIEAMEESMRMQSMSGNHTGELESLPKESEAKV